MRLLTGEFGYTIASASTDSGEVHEPGEPQAAIERIVAALSVIPNAEDWEGWNATGMATWRGTGGSPAGFVAFNTWSAKSPKYDPDTTKARWEGYFRSPPTHIGAGTIFYRADRASPGWWQPQPDLGFEPPPWEPDSDPEPQPDPEPEPEPKPQPRLLPYVDLTADL